MRRVALQLCLGRLGKPGFLLSPFIARSGSAAFFSGTSQKGDEIHWVSLLADPSKWDDYRRTKRSPDNADFRLKDVHLWMMDAPVVLRAGLGALSVESCRNGLAWRSVLKNPGMWNDNRDGKKGDRSPDFKHTSSGDAAYLNSAPDWAKQELESVPKEVFHSFILWTSVVKNPAEWMDMREVKKGSTEPDFKRKENNEALWLGTAPKWVAPELALIPTTAFANIIIWTSVVERPQEWVDLRRTQKGPRAPDFRKKDGSYKLWLNAVPLWIRAKIDLISHSAFA
jgi:hypothetical protein